MSTRIRSIRIFLSSTFADMQVEREFLVKNIFPAIQKIAKQRYVDFSIVDLRWGITEEEAHTGKVIEVCLDEIQNTHPFFIGLLGDRYGWCPNEKDITLSERTLSKYPWLTERLRQGISITEMEMRYGVLENPTPVNAYFFIRDSELQELSPRLVALRETIEASAGDKYQVQHFRSTEQLGRYVYASLLQLLDTLYPIDNSDPIHVLMDKEASLVRQHHVGYHNSRSLQMLESTVKAISVPRWSILLTGQGGEGKSALLCNWRPDSPQIIRTLLNEEIYSSEMVIAHFEAEVQKRGIDTNGIIWIIDGLEYLQTDEDRTLNWLKNESFTKVNLILSTHDEILAHVANAVTIGDHRHVEHKAVLPPTNEEKQEIIATFLGQFAKKLPVSQVQKIACHPLFSNVYLLQLFLWELVQFGSNERLQSFIDGYMQEKSKEQFVCRIFHRLEEDYGHKTVQIFFRLLSVTKIGLEESELQSFLGLNNIDWSAFSEAVRLMIVFSNGIIKLHPQIKNIAAEQYLDESEETNYWRKRFLVLRDQEYERQMRRFFRQVPWHSRLKARLRYWLYADLPVKEGWQQLDQINSDFIWQYLCLNLYEELARKRPYFHIERTNSDRDILLERRRVYNEHPERFMLLLPPRVLWVLGRKKWSTRLDYLCSTELKGKEQNIQILRKHIRHSWIPLWLKCKYENYLRPLVNRLQSATNEMIEEGWTTTALENIDTPALMRFILHEAPYLSPRRMERVEAETNNVLVRVLDVPPSRITEQHRSVYALMMIIKSFCCCSRRDFEDANGYFSAAVTVTEGTYNLVLLRYLIARGRGDEQECQNLIQLQRREQKGEQEQPLLRDNRLLVLYQLLALDHLAHNRESELEDTLHKLLALYPGNIEYAHYVRHNVAGLLRNSGAPLRSAFLYLEAAYIATHASIYVEDITSAAGCYWQEGQKEQARALLHEAIRQVDRPGNEAYVRALQEVLALSV